MAQTLKAFEKLTSSVNGFKNEYKLHYPDDPMSDIWSVRDILCHITYWHRYYVKNLAAEAKRKSYVLPKEPYYKLNQDGVEKMRPISDEKLIAMLTSANKRLGEIVLSGKVKQMTYREGNSPYTILNFLEMINSHIQAHTRGIKRKRKK